MGLLKNQLMSDDLGFCSSRDYNADKEYPIKPINDTNKNNPSKIKTQKNDEKGYKEKNI